MERRKRRLGVIVASVALAGGGVLGAATSAYAADTSGPSPSRVIGHNQGGDQGGGNQANQGGGGYQSDQGGGGNQLNQGGGNGTQLNQRGGAGPYTTWQSHRMNYWQPHARWIWIRGHWVPGHWARVW